MVGRLAGDDTVVIQLGEVAHAAEHAVGDARRAAAAGGQLHCAVCVDAHAHEGGRARDDAAQLLRRIQLQPERHAEAVAQRGGELPGARCGADERETRQIEPDGVGRWPLADDDVDGKVLHGGVEDLLHGGVQAVDLINKENVALGEVRQQRGQIARLFDGGAGRHADMHAHFVGDNAGERRLAEAGRTVEQHMVERLVAAACGLNVNRQVFLDLLLPVIFRQALRPQREFGLVCGREARCYERGLVVL